MYICLNTIQLSSYKYRPWTPEPVGTTSGDGHISKYFRQCELTHTRMTKQLEVGGVFALITSWRVGTQTSEHI